jgi:photosystem II stability/assembly factor-like uncharacterized protein
MGDTEVRLLAKVTCAGRATLCLVAGLVLTAGILTAAGPASASSSHAPAPAGSAVTWPASVRKPPPVVSLSGVSCTSAKVCEAVGFSGAAGVVMGTTNGGATWAAQPLPARIGALSGIACPSAKVCEAVGDYTNSFTFASTGLIVRTTDGGKTWRRQTIPPGTKSLSGITCPTTSSCLAAGFGFNDYNLVDYGAVLGTTDGGKTWEVDTLPASPTAVAQATAVTCPTTTLCYLGGSAVTGKQGGDAILGSDDFGATWTFQKLPSSLARNGGSVAGLACVSDTTCTAGDDSGNALGTTDGKTWAAQPVPHGVAQLNGVGCVSAGVCKAVGALSSGKGVVLTKAGTGSWTAQKIPASVGPLAGVACVSAGACEAVGQTSSANARAAAVGTANGGKTWTAQPLVNGIGLTAVDCGSASACTAVGTNGLTGAILGTTNGGRTWAREPVPSTLPATTRLVAVACPSASVCETVGFGFNGTPVALGTANGGKTWVDQTKRLPSGAGTFAGVSCPSTSVCEAVGSQAGLGFIIRTANAGKTWTFQFLNFQATAVNGISCVSATVCTALGQNGDETIVLQTTNGGKAWTSKTITTVEFPKGIACATATVCEVTGFRFSIARQDDVAVIAGTTNGWKTSARQTVPSAVTELFDVACPAKGQCAAVGNAGRAGSVVLGTSNGGSTWSAQPVGSRVNTLSGVSCLSVRLCAAAGLGGTGGGVVLTRRAGG